MTRLLLFAAALSLAACASDPEAPDADFDGNVSQAGPISDPGPMPVDAPAGTVQPTSTVRLDYVGTLPDGSTFDSGSNVTFSMQEVVPGFTKGMTGMEAGETRTFDVAPADGYGANPPPGIPANTDLTFEVTGPRGDVTGGALAGVRPSQAGDWRGVVSTPLGPLRLASPAASRSARVCYVKRRTLGAHLPHSPWPNSPIPSGQRSSTRSTTHAPGAGRPMEDERQTVEAVVWRHRNGAKWRAVPAEFGPWARAAHLHIRWSELGVWERAFEYLRDRGHPDLSEGHARRHRRPRPRSVGRPTEGGGR